MQKRRGRPPKKARKPLQIYLTSVELSERFSRFRAEKEAALGVKLTQPQVISLLLSEAS